MELKTACIPMCVTRVSASEVLELSHYPIISADASGLTRQSVDGLIFLMLWWFNFGAWVLRAARGGP